MVAHREGSGEAEYHATQADVFVVQSGEATLVVGGELVDGKTTRAQRNARRLRIKGGTEKKLAAGDVVTIPAKVAHQVKLDAGKQFTYFVGQSDAVGRWLGSAEASAPPRHAGWLPGCGPHPPPWWPRKRR